MSLAKDLLKSFDEKMDVEKVIKDLVEIKPSDDNNDQGKFVQLLKGLAFSEDPRSDKFMKKLMDMVDESFL